MDNIKNLFDSLIIFRIDYNYRSVRYKLYIYNLNNITKVAKDMGGLNKKFIKIYEKNYIVDPLNLWNHIKKDCLEDKEDDGKNNKKMSIINNIEEFSNDDWLTVTFDLVQTDRFDPLNTHKLEYNFIDKINDTVEMLHENYRFIMLQQFVLSPKNRHLID